MNKLSVILPVALPRQTAFTVAKKRAIIPMVQLLALADTVDGRVDVHLAAIDFAPKINDAHILQDVKLARHRTNVRSTEG